MQATTANLCSLPGSLERIDARVDEGSRLHTHFLPQLLFYATIFSIPYFALREISAAVPFLKVDWLLVGALTAIIIPSLILEPQSRPAALRSNLWRWLALFLVVNLVSSLVSPYRDHALPSVVNPILVGYIFITICLVMISAKGYEKYLPIVLAWSIGINSFLGFLEYFLGVEPFSGEAAERGRGYTIGANNMALMGVFTIPLLLHWILHARNRRSAAVGSVLLVVNILGVISSASRGGFLSMVVIGTLALLSLRHKFEPRYFGLVVAGGAAFVALAVAFVPEDYILRQATILEGSDADKSTDRRTAYLQVGMRAFAKRPIVGSGTDCFRKIWVKTEETRRFDMVERPAHNTYIEVLVGSGILGLLAFLILLGQAFKNFTRARKMFAENGMEELASLTAAYRLSMLAVLMYFFFKSGLDHKLYLLILPLSQIALTLAMKHNKTKNES